MNYKVFKAAIKAKNVFFDTRTELFVVPDKNSITAMNSADREVILGQRYSSNGEKVASNAVISKADIRELFTVENERLSGSFAA